VISFVTKIETEDREREKSFSDIDDQTMWLAVNQKLYYRRKRKLLREQLLLPSGKRQSHTDQQ
jgi:hypothetical protein